MGFLITPSKTAPEISPRTPVFWILQGVEAALGNIQK
jgi:hypothetical protein